MNDQKFHDQPADFPTTQVNGAPLKPLPQVVLERRATPHFKPDPVPEAYIEAILRFGSEAPSGFNLQPWRFLVVRNAQARQRLQRAAMDQKKVGEAPVVIIFFAVKDEWKKRLDVILGEGVRRGVGKVENIPSQKAMITEFVDAVPTAMWFNRHVMIAFTVMMLAAEAYGLDTAPMEGFDPEAVKREFKLPAEAEVVALLAMGFGQPPDKPYGGRLPLWELAFQESYGSPWPNSTSADYSTGEISPVDKPSGG